MDSYTPPHSTNSYMNQSPYRYNYKYNNENDIYDTKISTPYLEEPEKPFGISEMFFNIVNYLTNPISILKGTTDLKISMQSLKINPALEEEDEGFKNCDNNTIQIKPADLYRSYQRNFNIFTNENFPKFKTKTKVFNMKGVPQYDNYHPNPSSNAMPHIINYNELNDGYQLHLSIPKGMKSSHARSFFKSFRPQRSNSQILNAFELYKRLIVDKNLPKYISKIEQLIKDIEFNTNPPFPNNSSKNNSSNVQLIENRSIMTQFIEHLRLLNIELSIKNKYGEKSPEFIMLEDVEIKTIIIFEIDCLINYLQNYLMASNSMNIKFNNHSSHHHRLTNIGDTYLYSDIYSNSLNNVDTSNIRMC